MATLSDDDVSVLHAISNYLSDREDAETEPGSHPVPNEAMRLNDALVGIIGRQYRRDETEAQRNDRHAREFRADVAAGTLVRCESCKGTGWKDGVALTVCCTACQGGSGYVRRR